MAFCLFLIYLAFTFITLAQAWPALVFEIGSAVFILSAILFTGMPWFVWIPLLLIILLIVAFIHLDPLREAIADSIFKEASKNIPKLSKTEEEALSAGDVWLEQAIFTGNIDWQKLASVSTVLTDEEQAFLDNETETLCAMLNEWDIGQTLDLPENVWTYIREKGFFGLVISKEYGGKGFSARAHSDVVMKLASRSGVAAVSVMVPNSLGPGELLQYYGTEEQKSHYLPRLAKGEEIPCFALTEPGAGSDATSIQSEAIVEQGIIGGKSVLGLRISLNKRWITLSPVATLIGLAVNLRDPNDLLEGEGEPGITCLLIPRDTKNLEIGNRHLPALQPFMNGTIRGNNLFVPISSIIGGQKMAGKGWQMLVECLSIGRSISLPALGAASSAMAYITCSAYSRIRRQFNVDIGQFEGIEEKLAEIGGLNYLANATRLLTVAAVNAHKKPSVASAITKFINTELGRITVNHAMDIHAGRAVVMGPRNYLTNHYMGVPISITVEGANIMSRNLLIFGQGSMACHPYIRDEFQALRNGDREAFKPLLWNHIGYFMQNLGKMICSAWTGGLLIQVPGETLVWEQKQLVRFSQAYAFIADFSLIFLGGDLKRKERLSARLADGMIYLYMAMAVLRHYQEQVNDDDQKTHAEWALAWCFHKAQQSLLAFTENFPFKVGGWLMRILAFPLGQTMKLPADKLDRKLSRIMATNNSYRNNLKKSLYFGQDANQAVQRMEHALQLILQHQDLYQKIPDLRRTAVVDFKNKLQEKVSQGVLRNDEMEAILAMEKARWDAIQVDEFTFDSMKNKVFQSVTDSFENPFE